MLVLSRKVGESIQIGDDVRIIVNRIAGNRITIAVDAPRSVKIVRGELAQNSDLSAVSVEAMGQRASNGDHENGSVLTGAAAVRAIALDLNYEVAGFAPRNAR